LDPTLVSQVDSAEKGMTEALHFKVKSAEALIAQALAAVNAATGLLEFMGSDFSAIPSGTVVSPETGTSMTGTALGTEADVGVAVAGGKLKYLSVTGVASVADISKAVYATDGQTYTLTRPSTYAAPVGVIVYKNNGSTNTYCWVYLFSFVDSCKLHIAGGNKECKYLGWLEGSNLMDVTDATVVFTKPMYGHGKITNFHLIGQGYDTNWSAGEVVLNPYIASTTIKDTAAAAVTLTPVATAIDAAADRTTTINPAVAIGSANEYHDGQTLSMKVVNSGSTAFAGGAKGGFNVYADIEHLAGS